MYQPSVTEKIINKFVNLKINFYLRLYSIIDNLFIKNNYSPKNFNQVFFAYIAFGEKYIDALLDFSLPSILQKDNIPLIVKNGYKVIIKIYVKEENEKHKILNHPIYNKLDNFTNIEIVLLNKKSLRKKDYKHFNLINYFWPEDWLFKYHALYNALIFSFEQNSSLYWVAPDDFYGNGSLLNILKLSKTNIDFFLGQHARVNWDPVLELIKIKFKNNPDCTIDNRELVKIGLDHLINAQKLSIENDEDVGVSGLRIKQINQNTYAITSSRPAPIFGGITKSDLSFFRKFSHFNYNDFLWPRKLIREGRAKYINDSDIFFKIELSEIRNYKVKKIVKKELRMNPYGGTKRLLNHKIHEMYPSIWKL